MYRMKSIKYLALTGIVTALLFIIGFLSSIIFTWVNIAGFSILQLFDGLLIPFTAFFPGPMMLFAGPIAAALLDLISAVKTVVIPVSIIIRIIMFFIIKLLIIKKYWWSCFYAFLLAVVPLIILYPTSYIFIYNNKAIVINELISDSIQAVFAYVIGIIIYYFLFKIEKKSSNNFWDDSKFDYLKNKN